MLSHLKDFLLKVIKRYPDRNINCGAYSLTNKLAYCFSSINTRFHSSRIISEIWKELQFETSQSLKKSFHQTTNFEQCQYKDNLQKKLMDQRAGFIIKINEMMNFLTKESFNNDKTLSMINLTSQELVTQLRSIKQTVEELTKDMNSFSHNEIKEKINFVNYMKMYLSQQPSINRYFSQFFKLAFILEACIKIKCVLQFFQDFKVPDSIINSSLEKYAYVWENIELIKFPNSIKTTKEYQMLQIVCHFIGGAIMTSGTQSSLLKDQLRFTAALMNSTINFRMGVMKNLEMHYRGVFDKILLQMNLVDQGVFKALLQLTYPKIKTNLMIYIPLDKSQDEKWDIFKESNQAIPVRILYYSELPRQDQNLSETTIQDIVIHMHGGGFVAFSSNAAQVFTIQWANQTKIPIFSIDYRLAPIYPYPQALQDCYRVYDFLVKHINKYFKIKAKNIYFGGDSAGGNLNCGLTALIMKNQLIVPKGLFLVYPSLDSRKMYYGSRKYILNDPILWPSLAKLAFDSYFGKKNEFTHPLASPLLLTQQYVNGHIGDTRFPLQWPKTYICVGTRDPLRDESLLFMQRMVQSGIECKCMLMVNLRHAYLNSEAMVVSSKGVVKHSSKLLNELIESTKISIHSKI